MDLISKYFGDLNNRIGHYKIVSAKTYRQKDKIRLDPHFFDNCIEKKNWNKRYMFENLKYKVHLSINSPNFFKLQKFLKVPLTSWIPIHIKQQKSTLTELNHIFNGTTPFILFVLIMSTPILFSITPINTIIWIFFDHEGTVLFSNDKWTLHSWRVTYFWKIPWTISLMQFVLHELKFDIDLLS